MSNKNHYNIVVAGSRSSPFDVWYFLLSRFPNLSDVKAIDAKSCVIAGKFDDVFAEEKLKQAICGFNSRGCDVYIGIRTRENETIQLGEMGEIIANIYEKPVLMLDSYDGESICKFIQRQNPLLEDLKSPIFREREHTF